MSSLRTLSYSLLTCPGQFKRTAVRLSKVYESNATLSKLILSKKAVKNIMHLLIVL